MVLVRFAESKLLRFSGLDEESLLHVPWELGGEARKENGNIVMEFNPDRPDLYSIQGVTRAIRLFRAKERPKSFTALHGALSADVIPPPKIPYFVLGIARGVRIKGLFEEIIDFQEKLHKTIGRNRRAAAIGLHDLSKAKFPLIYKPVPRSFKFKPLGEDREILLRDFMKSHEKAQEYGNLVDKKIPGIIDSSGKLISIPPILNSSITTVTEETRDVLVDVTGRDERAVNKCLSLMLTSLTYPDGAIENLTINVKGKKGKRTPDLLSERRKIPKALLKETIGYSLQETKIKSSLSRMGYKIGKTGVIVPPYRFDVLDDIDLVEDILKGVGFANIKRGKENFVSYGKSNPVRLLESKIRHLLVGYDLSEVVNTVLVNKGFNSLFGFKDKGVDILNPISQEQDSIRTRLSPQLMQTLLNNFRNPYPQRIFEIGTVHRDGKETEVLGIAIAHKEASFSEIKGLFVGLLEDLGIENYDIQRGQQDMYIQGRLAGVSIDGKESGFFGEVKPALLKELGIKMPVAMGELDISGE